MTAALDLSDVEFLVKGVCEFEQLNGEVLGDGELPTAFTCGGTCSGNCGNDCGHSCTGVD